ncbi:response regulator [Antarcticirhabdus aurantiaca]|uniref:Response regulator n=1 Tax=Antarcticirhabdus aurantiaca TaxID=2606717 RepID=A0ACD4NMD4_9HYPH|nr:response regulator [Antarcticirhabdus aurantiaca]WAJ27893.1 response regulator [Jeongeuplla avenae]
MSFAFEAQNLEGKRILVVEDDYIQATSLADAIQRRGGHVIGPVPDVATALELVEKEGLPDAAVLDISLGDEASFAVSTCLREHGVPMLFVTGYDDWFMPNELDDIAVCQKPMDAENILRLLLPLRRG